MFWIPDGKRMMNDDEQPNKILVAELWEHDEY